MPLTGVHAGLSDISDRSSFNDVTDDKLLDSFVLWHTASTVGAAHWVDVATPVLRPSSVPTLASLKSTFSRN